MSRWSATARMYWATDPHVGAGGCQPNRPALAGWWKQIEQVARRATAWPSASIARPSCRSNAIERLLRAISPVRDAIVSTEVGQHQMWAAQFFKFQEPNRWMTSGGPAPWATGCRPRSACSLRIRSRW